MRVIYSALRFETDVGREQDFTTVKDANRVIESEGEEEALEVENVRRRFGER